MLQFCQADILLQAAWPTARLKAYIAWARENLVPETSPEAEALLLWYYAWRRRMAGRAAARTTIRLLQGLVRLSQVLLPQI